MEGIHTITLANGTVLSNLSLNGNNYISKTLIKESVFIRNCSPVIFSDGINDDLHDNMELVQITESNGEFWIVLRDIPEAELAAKKQRADIDYIAMMTDVEL